MEGWLRDGMLGVFFIRTLIVNWNLGNNINRKKIDCTHQSSLQLKLNYLRQVLDTTKLTNTIKQWHNCSVLKKKFSFSCITIGALKKSFTSHPLLMNSLRTFSFYSPLKFSHLRFVTLCLFSKHIRNKVEDEKQLQTIFKVYVGYLASLQPIPTVLLFYFTEVKVSVVFWTATTKNMLIIVKTYSFTRRQTGILRMKGSCVCMYVWIFITAKHMSQTIHEQMTRQWTMLWNAF